MDAYCPRCQVEVEAAIESLLKTGMCPTCSGQVFFGLPTTAAHLDGSVAMTFWTTGYVPVPLESGFVNTWTMLAQDAKQPKQKYVSTPALTKAQADAPKPEKTPGPPPPPEDALNEIKQNAVENTTSQGLETQHEKSNAGDRSMSTHENAFAHEQDDQHSDDDRTVVDSNPPTAAHMQALVANTEQQEEHATHGEQENVAEPREAETPKTNDTKVKTEAASDKPSSPAHLSLPNFNFDFSYPSTGNETSDSGSSEMPNESATEGAAPPETAGQESAAAAPADGDSSASAPSDVPAHLALPNFPTFDLPPIPGEEDKRVMDEHELTGVGRDTGSFGVDEEPPAIPPPVPEKQEKTDATSEHWVVGTPAEAVAPPLPSIQTPQTARPPAGIEPLPDLPVLGMPQQKTAKPKHEPTLIQHAVDDKTGSSHKGLIIGLVLVFLLGAGSIGVVIGLGPSRVVAWFDKSKPVHVVETKRDKAEELLVLGSKAFRKGEQAENQGKAKMATKHFKEAKKHFERALKIDPGFAKPHRNLGSVLAKTNQQKKAVEHYETYLKMAPKAKDAPAVKKIVQEWRKAQKK